MQIAAVNGSRLCRKRRIHINRKIRILRRQMLCLNLAKEEEQLLCTTDRKGGNNHISAGSQRLVNNFSKFFGIVLHLFMFPVSVGRFHHYIIRCMQILRIPDDWLVLVSDITGKDQFSGDIVLCCPNFNRSTAQQMPGIGKTNTHTLTEFYAFSIFAAFQKLDSRLCIVNGIQRHMRQMPSTFPFS